MTQRQPKGIPVGGQFAANSHDEADGSLSPTSIFALEENLEAADINEGDTIDLTRNVIAAMEAGSTNDDLVGYTGRHTVTRMSWDEEEEMVRLELLDSTGTTRNWLVADEDTFDRRVDTDYNYSIEEPSTIDEGDLVDMTRTVDEYLSNPHRGGGEGVEEFRDMSALRNKLYRVEEVEDHGDGEYTVNLVSEDDPSDTVSWASFDGLTDFDVIAPSHPSR